MTTDSDIQKSLISFERTDPEMQYFYYRHRYP